MATPGLFVPPILQGTMFAGMEVHEHHTAFVFIAADPAIIDGVIRAKVIAKGSDPIFAYSIVDSETNTIRHYHGPHGDPTRDTWDDVSSFDDKK